ncbi:MAG: hypothetical protein WKF75_06245, partial [Singulisphaera sp.]
MNKILRALGNIVVAGTNADDNHKLSMVAGSRIIFDATAAGAGVRYGLQVGTAPFTRPMLYARGTAASPATITSDLAGGALPARLIDSDSIGQGCVDAEYLDFVDFGSATDRSWIAWPGMAGHELRLVNCNFTRCGLLDYGQALLGDSTFVLDRVKFKDTVADMCFSVSAASALTAGGVRTITHSAFDKVVKLFGPADFTIRYTVMEARWVHLNYRWAEVAHNFFRDPLQESFGICGDISDCYFLEDSNDG